MAQRMSMLYELNSPEFFDKALFRDFLDLLRQRGVIRLDGDGKLTFDDVLVAVADDARSCSPSRSATASCRSRTADLRSRFAVQSGTADISLRQLLSGPGPGEPHDQDFPASRDCTRCRDPRAGTRPRGRFRGRRLERQLRHDVSFGQSWREQGRDPRLIGTADGGSGRSPNIDDGDLNYKKGRVSSAYKIVAELSLDHDNYGLFVRGSLLYDDLVEDSKTARTPISEAGKDLAGSYIRSARRFRVRALGPRRPRARHPRGQPGGELGREHVHPGRHQRHQPFRRVGAARAGLGAAEAFLPQEMAKVSFGITDNLTAEAIALFDWDPTQPEPAGSYFSSNDFVPRGGSKVFLGFGAFSDQGVDFTLARRPVHHELPGRAARRHDHAVGLRPVRRVAPVLHAQTSSTAPSSASTS